MIVINTVCFVYWFATIRKYDDDLFGPEIF